MTLSDEELENAVANGLHSVYLAHDEAGNVIGHIGKLHEAIVAEVAPLLRQERQTRAAAEAENVALRHSLEWVLPVADALEPNLHKTIGYAQAREALAASYSVTKETQEQ